MPATFWNGWQLWEKMCFILGCAIVVVIFGGCIKLVYNHYRLRKYTKLAADKAAIREQLQRTASVNHGRGKEIPFGIRALESGIAIDGVWISGSNTPANSTPGSPTLPAMTEKAKATPQKTLTSERASSSTNMTRIEIENDQSHPSVPVRSTYQPRRSSGLRFSDVYDLGDRAAALAALEGHPVSIEPAEKIVDIAGHGEAQEAHRRSQSWATTAWTDGRDLAIDLDQTTSSRFPQHPLRRVSNRLGGFPHKERDDSDRNDRGAPEISAVYMSSKGHAPMSYEDLSYQEASHQEGQVYDNRSASSEGSDPFLTQSTMKGSSAFEDGSPIDHELDEDDLSPDGPTIDSHKNAYADMPADGPLPHRSQEALREARKSQVIRKINSGFEILRPGTFDLPRQSAEIAERGNRSNSQEAGNKRQSKKLQRRRRDSNLSKT